MILQNAPNITATTDTAIISGQNFRIAESGMAIIPLFVCHHHSGGSNGMRFGNKRINAAMAQSTAHMITGTNMSSCMPHMANIDGNMAHAIAPHVSCRPISERPDDVSRVAIMMAVFNKTIMDTGKMSASDRIAKYVQKVASGSPSICKRKNEALKCSPPSSIAIVLCTRVQTASHTATHFYAATLRQNASAIVWVGQFTFYHWLTVAVLR